MEISTRGATAVDIDAVAAFIARLNRDAESRCLHAGEEAGELRQALLRLSPPFASTFTLAITRGNKDEVALHDGRLLGVAGVDLDLAASRAWLWGPWIEHGHWSVVAPPLLDRVLWFVRELDRVDAYVDEAATRARQLLESRGFGEPERTLVYVARAPLAAASVAGEAGFTITSFAAEHEAEFLALHRAIFLEEGSGQDLIAARSDDNPILVAVEAGRVIGYLVAAVEVDPSEALIRYVGVRADARGRGVGRALLETALAWALQTKGLPQAALTVRETNTNARALYEGLGFRLELSGIHLRRARSA
ncbi:MAG: GNAT family N-acetyltransferase [Candidatus Eisenbacteria bacterium]